MFHKLLSVGICVLGMFLLPSNAIAQTNQILSYAKNQNIVALKQLKQSLGTLDYPNRNGQTALCLAVYQNDYEAFSILAKLGANKKHPCMQTIPLKQKALFNNKYKNHYSKKSSIFTNNSRTNKRRWVRV